VACSTFDGQVVRQESQIRDLTDQFVCLRIVQGNGLDLGQFQFDYDLTFAAFFMNADRTIYGRFGTRSTDKDAARDISVEGFRAALRAALELHKNYPRNKSALAGKQGRPARFKVPEEFPSLKDRYTANIDYADKPARSCIHCHMVRDADRRLIRETQKFVPDESLYPWPMPNEVGLTLDPREKAKVISVRPGSTAARDGFASGDEILFLDGQPMVSIADVQWVLQNAKEPASLKASVRRGNKTVSLPLTLEKGWRKHSNVSWRPTSWDLRRMALGGMFLEDLTDEERRAANLNNAQMALRAKHVGEYGEHALAKKAGLQKDDIVTSFDGKTDRMTESELFGYVLQNKEPGARLRVTVLRGQEKINFDLPVP
jgi:hypothetical protein